jgi:hypothetical protein
MLYFSLVYPSRSSAACQMTELPLAAVGFFVEQEERDTAHEETDLQQLQGAPVLIQ